MSLWTIAIVALVVAIALAGGTAVVKKGGEAIGGSAKMPWEDNADKALRMDKKIQEERADGKDTSEKDAELKKTLDKLSFKEWSRYQAKKAAEAGKKVARGAEQTMAEEVHKADPPPVGIGSVDRFVDDWAAKASPQKESITAPKPSTPLDPKKIWRWDGKNYVANDGKTVKPIFPPNPPKKSWRGF